MTYTIKAPSEDYNRTVAGIQFINGVAKTEDDWTAQWFSGREGFNVESKDKAKDKPKDKPKDKAKDTEKADK